MKISVIAKKTGYSSSHIRRLAAQGLIPGCRTTKGGHYFCYDTMALRQWVGRQKARKANRRLKTHLRLARRDRAQVYKDKEKNIGPKMHLLGPMQVRWASWRNHVLLKRLYDASPEVLRYWLANLKEPYVAYMAIKARLAEITEPPQPNVVP